MKTSRVNILCTCLLTLAFIPLINFSGCAMANRARPGPLAPSQRTLLVQPIRISKQWNQAAIDRQVAACFAPYAAIGITVKALPTIDRDASNWNVIETFDELHAMCVGDTAAAPAHVVRAYFVEKFTIDDPRIKGSAGGYGYPWPGGLAISIGGGFSQLCLAHELGHVLGLLHPTPVDACGDPAIARSIMSYCHLTQGVIVESDQPIALAGFERVLAKVVTAARIKPTDAQPFPAPTVKQRFTLSALSLSIGDYLPTAPAPVSLPSNLIPVTNLKDTPVGAPPINGSLRAAIASAPPGSIIYFQVAGQIKLLQDLRITRPYLCIDGSTAPDGGITLVGHQLSICNTKFVYLRNMRIRSGDGYTDTAARKAVHGTYNVKVESAGGKVLEASTGGIRSVVIFSENDGECSDVTVENCSIQNSTDDDGVVQGDCRRILFSRCLFSGGYSEVIMVFPKGVGDDVPIDNSRGFMIDAPGQPLPSYTDFLTLDHCCFPFLRGRGPDLAGGVVRLINNVMVQNFQGGKITYARADIIGNYFVTLNPHPWGASGERQLTAYGDQVSPGAFFVAHNCVDGKLLPGAAGVIGEIAKGNTELPASCFRSAPWIADTRSIVPAPQALKEILDTVGCTSPRRDETDQAVIAAIRAAMVKR